MARPSLLVAQGAEPTTHGRIVARLRRILQALATAAESCIEESGTVFQARLLLNAASTAYGWVGDRGTGGTAMGPGYNLSQHENRDQPASPPRPGQSTPRMQPSLYARGGGSEIRPINTSVLKSVVSVELKIGRGRREFPLHGIGARKRAGRGGLKKGSCLGLWRCECLVVSVHP